MPTAREALDEAEQLGLTGSWEQDLVTGAIVNSAANHRLFFDDDAGKGARLEDYLEAIHPEDRDRVARGRGAMLDGTGSGDIEYRVVRADGSIRWLFGRAHVVRDDAGRAVRVYGTNADITARKRLAEDAERRAQQLEALSRKLTPRQLEVLQLVAEGYSSKQIAGRLSVSVSTVELHRGDLMERLGVHGVAALVRCAVQAGLVPPPS
jgi:DNA-binding CsgD family transcriptional regulator